MKNLGKISVTAFEDFIQNSCGYKRKEVLAGPQFGVDVSVTELPAGNALLQTSDPLSLIPSLGLEESAWLSVHLMANDMATTGFAPMYGQFVLNLPTEFSKQDFKVYWNYIDTFCKEIGVAITGGHTGFIPGQNSTIAGGGTFTSVAPLNKVRLSKNAKPGDVILVTKSCALSASAILAMSFPEAVKNKAGHEVYQNACKSFYDTSSLRDAQLAVGINQEYEDVTGMHDVTEGGVLGAIYELCVASECGARVLLNDLPIENVQKAVCDLFQLDPKYTIGAGAMIITCRPGAEQAVIERLSGEGIRCTIAGFIQEAEGGILAEENGRLSPLEYKEEDLYWSAFFKAINLGWK